MENSQHSTLHVMHHQPAVSARLPLGQLCIALAQFQDSVEYKRSYPCHKEAEIIGGKHFLNSLGCSYYTEIALCIL